MRKIYTFMAALMMSGGMFGQVTLFQDQFDTYPVGTGPVANDPVHWNYWSTSNSDAYVDTAYAFSGANSCRIQGNTTDLVLPIGPFTGGRYAVSFQMLIPTGSTGAYFNALHDWSTSQTSYEWGMDVFFDGNGAVSHTVGFVNEALGDSVPIGEWFDVKMIFYLDVDSVALIMQGDTLFKKQWSLNNADGTAGMNRIAGVDFYGTDANQGSGLYYIDDVVLEDVSNVGIFESAQVETLLFPNPCHDQVMIRTANVRSSLKVYNVQGQLVHSQIFKGANGYVSTADWTNGIYQMVIEQEGGTITQSLMVNH